MNNAFIIGTGRCGTTYLAQILNTHSKVCVPPEMQCVFEYDTNGSRFYENVALGTIADATAAADLIERCCPHDLERFFNYREYCKGLSYPLCSMEDFFANYYAAIAKSYNKEVLIEQTPWYGQRMDIMTRVFPNAKFVHVVRDGRDVALSFARTPWWFKKAELNLARWANEIKKIATDAAALLCPENYLVVKYENLVADTDAEVLRICDFLGLTLESAQLDPENYIDYDSYCKFDMDNLSSAAYLKWKKNKGLSSFQGSVFAWKNETSELFENPPPTVAASLRLYGYEVQAGKDSEGDVAFARYNVKMYVTELESKVAVLDAAVSARQLTIYDQSVHIRSVETELAVRGQRLAEFEYELTARGEHIAGLAHTIDDQARHIHSLDGELLSRAERIFAVEQELTTLKNVKTTMEKTIGDLTGTIQVMERDRLAQVHRYSELEEDLLAKNEHISTLTHAFEDQANHVSELAADRLYKTEQLAMSEAELIACVGRIAVLENAINDQAQHIQSLDSEVSLRTEQIAEYKNREASLSEKIAKHDTSIARQAERINALVLEQSERVKHIDAMEYDKNIQDEKVRTLNDGSLKQQIRIDELNAEVLRMKESLDQWNASWCGRLQALRQKLHK